MEIKIEEKKIKNEYRQTHDIWANKLMTCGLIQLVTIFGNHSLLKLQIRTFFLVRFPFHTGYLILILLLIIFL